MYVCVPVSVSVRDRMRFCLRLRERLMCVRDACMHAFFYVYVSLSLSCVPVCVRLRV